MTQPLSPAEQALHDAALEYHRAPVRGKIAVTPLKPLMNAIRPPITPLTASTKMITGTSYRSIRNLVIVSLSVKHNEPRHIMAMARTVPGVAIFVASLAFNLLGDGLRDVLDPKQR